MIARALLKTDYHGRELARVNLRGKGIVDCDTKLARLASTLRADYWEIQYNLHYENAQTLTCGNKQLTLRG